MKKPITCIFIVLALSACSQKADITMDKSTKLCGNKPNCVSTLENRETFSIPSFTLTNTANTQNIAAAALQLKGAKVVFTDNDYVHIECTSLVFRFVDDLELRISGDTLIVRSESRTGHSDFGVNRKRVEQLREILLKKGLISK
ncbi:MULTISPECIES: DUF1499 domain-containing protein [unclassified Aliivibrio]|jgi:uncharacterized protein (DUF1499 family)|uniref:DUF1499 domain-containing protein n=1 Tax=unclassified Aliivibrio TaxID=2645654 RepID=UPI00080EB4A3|nr:hypothetical protein A6E05_08140 [Aliivibrio sp. 1S165]OCH25113.1 hypothetical protein A6E03_04940 [Aliivibrio sp. 1S128]OCH28208.1 hypothetical protein A6E06_07295 [Aliivibrio sp. 1S175]